MTGVCAKHQRVLAKAIKLAKTNDRIIVTTGTTDTLNSIMKVCDVD